MTTPDTAVQTLTYDDMRRLRTAADMQGLSAEFAVLEAAADRALRAPSGAPINQPEAACVRAALLLALDYSTSNLIHIDSLYGGYPENGLGRKVKAAREEVAMVRRALAATPPAAAQEKP